MTPISSLASPPTQLQQRVANEQKIDKTVKAYTGFFFGTVLDQMTQGLKTDGIFGGGFGEEVYRSLLNHTYGEKLAERMHLPIEDQMKQQLLRIQEGKHDTGLQ